MDKELLVSGLAVLADHLHDFLSAMDTGKHEVLRVDLEWQCRIGHLVQGLVEGQEVPQGQTVRIHLNVGGLQVPPLHGVRYN